MKNTPKTVEELNEMRARVLADWDGHDFDKLHKEGTWTGSGPSQDCYLKRARAIREADERAELVTMPVEPTLDMHCNSSMRSDIYDAMLSASPFAKRES